MSGADIDCSLVIPVYYNAGCLLPTWEKLQSEIFRAYPQLRFEVIYIDDGSGDNSLQELLEIQSRGRGVVRIIKLTRNFGQVNALQAGFEHARGKCLIAMSADGQEPLSLVGRMLEAHRQEGYEVVICHREGRDDGIYRAMTSKIFYALMRKLCFRAMPLGGFDTYLLGRRALNVLLRNRETSPFLQGQILWTGFQPKMIGYYRQNRIAGKSRWSFGKKITYLLDGILSYSYFPIRLMSLLGVIFSVIGFLYAVVVFADRIFHGNPVRGWSPLMIVVLVMGGVQMLMLGMIGEYLWRTLAQTRHRDNYIIDDFYE